MPACKQVASRPFRDNPDFVIFIKLHKGTDRTTAWCISVIYEWCCKFFLLTSRSFHKSKNHIFSRLIANMHSKLINPRKRRIENTRNRVVSCIVVEEDLVENDRSVFRIVPILRVDLVCVCFESNFWNIKQKFRKCGRRSVFMAQASSGYTIITTYC